jgi:hypothetical protein
MAAVISSTEFSNNIFVVSNTKGEGRVVLFCFVLLFFSFLKLENFRQVSLRKLPLILIAKIIPHTQPGLTIRRVGKTATDMNTQSLRLQMGTILEYKTAKMSM